MNRDDAVLAGPPVWVQALGRVHGHELAGGGIDAAGLAAHLAAMGFAPVDETPAAAARDGAVALRLGRCPFRDAVEARGGGLVCALHRGLTAGLVESSGGELVEFEVVDPVHAGCRVVAGGLRPAAPTPG